MTHRWDPARYLAFADERGRPFVDLLARVGAADPRTVVDLGCGPGNLTGLLAERWPGADVLGLDSSVDMIERARANSSTVEYDVADLRDWQPPQPGRLVRVPGARQLRRAQPHHPRRPRRRGAPKHPYGVALPFLSVFAVAQVPA